MYDAEKDWDDFEELRREEDRHRVGWYQYCAMEEPEEDDE